MKIIDRRASLEPCSESGWDALDFITKDPLSDEDIEAFRALKGSFLYLKSLKKPFFKIEDHGYVIKGVRGDRFFRFAFHREICGDPDVIIGAIENKREGGKAVNGAIENMRERQSGK